MLQTLYFPDRKGWRAWLKKNYKKEKGVWLIYYKKQTGKPRIPYNDAVEEALCFGWIDSTVKRIDDERFAQRFSRRNLISSYSQANKQRLKQLIASGKVMVDVLPTLDNMLAEKFELPKDILKIIKNNKVAWENFQNYSETYQHIRIAFIDGAWQRPEEFQKRLKYFIRMTEKNKQFGFGGIDKYY
jgi:uncharacterized protein YdeI (YjbR/CyaY-like superfamily)